MVIQQSKKREIQMSGIGAEDLRTGVPWWGGAGCDVGDSIEGIVVSAGKEQQRDFDTGALLEWDNGDPRMESVVVLETKERRDDIENDDGKRALHLRGGNYTPEKGDGVAGEKALLKAIQESGLRCEPGMHLKATITGKAKPTGRGRQAAKLWTMELSKPASALDEGDFSLDD